MDEEETSEPDWVEVSTKSAPDEIDAEDITPESDDGTELTTIEIRGEEIVDPDQLLILEDCPSKDHAVAVDPETINQLFDSIRKLLILLEDANSEEKEESDS